LKSRNKEGEHLALFEVKQKAKLEPYKPEFIKPGHFTEEELPTAQLIQRRRLQMLVHSCIYYDMDANLITDKQFDEWGKELVKLQSEYPEIASRVCYAKAFKDWDASTGAFLPLQDPWVIRKAQQLLSINSGASKGDNDKLEHKKVQQSTRVESSKKSKGKKATKQRGNSLF
jgi:hypothetical protein